MFQNHPDLPAPSPHSGHLQKATTAVSASAAMDRKTNTPTPDLQPAIRSRGRAPRSSAPLTPALRPKPLQPASKLHRAEESEEGKRSRERGWIHGYSTLWFSHELKEMRITYAVLFLQHRWLWECNIGAGGAYQRANHTFQALLTAAADANLNL